MSFTTPIGQLLGRQPDDAFDGWLLVAPVIDEGLLEGPARRLWCLDHAIATAFRARGHAVMEGLSPAWGEVPVGALLFWPKTLALGCWWVRELCRQLPPGTPLWIVGEHHGGVRRVPGVLEALGMSHQRVDNARRCSLFATHTLEGSADDSWIQFEALGVTLISHPGVFGHGKLDAGTRLLLEHLPTLSGRVLDIGCGDGIIATTLAKGGAQVTAVDSHHLALEATRRTLAANDLQGTVMASDMLTAVEGPFEAIVTNPPFHQARSVDTEPSRRMIEAASRHLVPGGALYVVANTFLPYAEPLKRSFRMVEVLADDRRFRVYRAAN